MRKALTFVVFEVYFFCSINSRPASMGNPDNKLLKGLHCEEIS